MPTQTPAVILRTYFGYRPNTGFPEFKAELKALSEEEKAELVALAARELGLEGESA